MSGTLFSPNRRRVHLSKQNKVTRETKLLHRNLINHIEKYQKDLLKESTDGIVNLTTSSQFIEVINIIMHESISESEHVDDGDIDFFIKQAIYYVEEQVYQLKKNMSEHSLDQQLVRSLTRRINACRRRSLSYKHDGGVV